MRHSQVTWNVSFFEVLLLRFGRWNWTEPCSGRGSLFSTTQAIVPTVLSQHKPRQGSRCSVWLVSRALREHRALGPLIFQAVLSLALGSSLT